MRPVLLDMDGFAAFREPTRVDFRGADYFVLVGPTGSGKSTVLDAISFALYGTVPRWEDRRKVALALAPTAIRGTVRLVFDVGGARYQVARELRRSGGANRQVSIKNARLERLADPAGLGELDEASELLAADSFVNDAIAKLLGLSFDHFCKCVSLPQGAFAEFLHAKPSDRDDILNDLLGLGVYEVIARRAREEAAGHRQSAAALTEQLAGYADATEDADQAAAGRVETVRTLAGTVDGAVPQLKKLADAVTREAERAGQLTDAAHQLGAVAPPDGLADLAARVDAAQVQYAAARTELAGADATDTVARAARRAAPDRPPLNEIARHHRELADSFAAEPGQAATLAEALQTAGEAAEETRTASQAEADARQERDTAAVRHKDAAALVERLTGELDALAAVTPPAGIGELTAQATAAREERDAAASALTEAETAEDQARVAARQAADRRTALQRAGESLDEITRLESGKPDLDDREQAAARAKSEAVTELKAAQGHLEHTQADYDQAARGDLAAVLRPQLTVGDDCPVCAQQVAVLPPPLPAEGLARAKKLLAAAKVRLRDAETAFSDAERAAERLEEDRQRLAARVTELRAQLTGAPDSRKALAAELAGIEQLVTAETDAATARKAARTRLAAADIAVGKVAAAGQTAARLLAQARDRLIALALDAPPAGEDVAAGWQQLHIWAKRQATGRRRELTGAQATAERETGLLAAAEQAFTAAHTAARQAHQAELSANRAGERAKERHDQLSGQITRLTGLLDGKPDQQQTLAELARLDELDEAGRKADERVRTARTDAERAQQQLTGLNDEVDEGWRQLRAARDPLVRFDAPEPSGDDLQAGWAQLRAWATQQSAAHSERASAAQADLAKLETSLDAAAAELTAALTDAGISVRTDVPLAEAAPVAVATAVAEAVAAVERIAERRTHAADLEQRRAAAERDQQVAAHLGQLLRTDNFPRWLAASALNTLLMEASASLLELSGGQFELTHDGTGGDLLIVDHADADSRRPVKTLSGGETFQASLALALALSSQMAALAEAGAARLDSIFLDEGFGTLDEATLETVADTLETLAGQKERMVGVITHVPALAERIPVKFIVARDQSSSRVTRSDA